MNDLLRVAGLNANEHGGNRQLSCGSANSIAAPSQLHQNALQTDGTIASAAAFQTRGRFPRSFHLIIHVLMIQYEYFTITPKQKALFLLKTKKPLFLSLSGRILLWKYEDCLCYLTSALTICALMENSWHFLWTWSISRP